MTANEDETARIVLAQLRGAPGGITLEALADSIAVELCTRASIGPDSERIRELEVEVERQKDSLAFILEFLMVGGNGEGWTMLDVEAVTLYGLGEYDRIDGRDWVRLKNVLGVERPDDV